MTKENIYIEGVVVDGHKVASGEAPDSPFPDSTIKMQSKYYILMGMNPLRESVFYPGTINIDISPLELNIVKPDDALYNIKWSVDHDPESFHLVECSMIKAPHSSGHKWYQGKIYYPLPHTKIDHFQGNGVIEILAPWINGLEAGDRVMLGIPKDRVEVYWAPDGGPTRSRLQ